MWLVARPRLFDLLTTATQGSLTVVSAPAGAGKTMLLASWAWQGRPPGPVAWVSLDPADNDPSRLLARVLAALRSAGAVPDGASLATLAPPEQGGVADGVGAFLAALSNGLGELSGPVVVVLDNIQELTGRSLAHIELLVRRAPAQLRLILAGRTDPAMSLSRLRVAGEVTEVRMTELALNRTEAAELFDRAGVSLYDDEVAVLWARTEGWAHGLRLAAQAPRLHREDPSAYIAAFGGGDGAIAAYLREQVLARQPAEVREFLLHTSVAERLTGELADALTGRHGGAQQLVELELANAFLVPLDAKRTWYRYHRLFAELLRAELRRTLPQQVAELHRRAARWHGRNANGSATLDAIHHALAAEDWDYARSLLVERWAILWAGAITLRDLLARLPSEQLRGDAELEVAAAGSHLNFGDVQAAEGDLLLAEANAATVAAGRHGEFALALALVHAYRARLLGDPEGLRGTAGELLRLLDGGEGAPQWSGAAANLRAAAQACLAVSELWSGDVELAAAHLEESLALVRRTAAAWESLTLLDCLSQLALAEMTRGRLQRASDLGHASVGFAERRGWSQTMQAFGGHLAAAWSHYHRNELTAATRHLERASQAAHGRVDAVAVAIVQCWLLQSQGRLDAALAALRAAAAVCDSAGWQPPYVVDAVMRVSEAAILAATGDTGAARALLSPDVGAASAALMPADAAVILAMVQQAEGDLDGAAATLASRPDAGMAQAVHPYTILVGALLDAAVAAERGDDDRAAAALEDALTLAAAEDYRRVFVDGSVQIRALLTRQLDRGSEHPALVVGLLAMFDQEAGGVPQLVPEAPGAISEPVTEREQTVLRYLPTQLSAVEIAAELSVSMNTVKTHTQHLYRKLGVASRRDAVNRARRLGLL